MPEWILIEKQVRESIQDARINLKRVFKTIATENSLPPDELKIYLSNNDRWIQAVEKFRAEITEINVNINKLNLVVPMLWRQQVQLIKNLNVSFKYRFNSRYIIMPKKRLKKSLHLIL